MARTLGLRLTVVVGGLVLGAVTTAAAAEPAKPGAAIDPPLLEFFEKEIRPLIANRCQSCHGDAKQKGGLRLDSREGVMAGGTTGPAVVPGKPDESLLIEAVNYGDLFQMPPKSKLPPKEIATLTRWVELGAPWPASHGSPAPGAKPKEFNLKERAKHWSFQPVRTVAPPAVKNAGWARNDVDRFLLAALEGQGLSPAPEADKRTLIRRLTFDLTGLPPAPDEVDAFLRDQSPAAYDRVVDRLLGSPRYGERWARHWLDLVRFAESAGHEFDYATPDAYRYRDYVVRALNADVPYDRFVVEHVAGDLVETPRRNPVDGSNESVQGTGFYFLGEGTHSPVDLLDDEARRVDNQIDVFAKTFLGLTIACARCHDHKFDPITTKDYYSLYGYLQSSRHQHAFIDAPERITARAERLRRVKADLAALIDVPRPARRGPVDAQGSILFEDFEGPNFGRWTTTGDAFGAGPSQDGEFTVALDGDVPVARSVASGQAHSGLLSNRLQGVLRSPTFTIEKPFIHYLAAGSGTRINVVIDGFEKIRDPIYGALTLGVDAPKLRWHSQDVTMWVGHRAYIELSDGATVDYRTGASAYFPGSGYLAVDEIRFSDRRDTPNAPAAEVAEVKLEGKDPALVACLESFRKIEGQIPAPDLALAILDGDGEDERVHLRGNSITLGDAVPRRFLEVFEGAGQASPEHGSGRLELAQRMVDPANPLVARVLVNRLWKHHFGQGIVGSTDDFGIMGQAPSNPELLDFLARRFQADGWSLKALHRLIVGSSAYRMSSVPEPEAERLDPNNVRLHRMNVRRLEGEAIRDALLAVSGRLDERFYGPSVAQFLTPFMDGRGRPAPGPLDGEGRRSLYLTVRRNFLNPMFLAFDAPVPFSTMGRRNVSNVPAQALTMLNDPLVLSLTEAWSEHARGELASHSRAEVLTGLYQSAFGRPPSEHELAQAGAFLDEQARAYGADDDPRAWADLCHVLVNVKEFIYVN